MGSILSAGLARSHRANPEASLRVLKLYGDPVLFSGLGSLVLKKQEVLIVDTHHKNYITAIQKLYKGTPRSFVYLVGGSLPGEAIVHLRQLTLFGMIARLSDKDPLKSHALYMLTELPEKSWSWFHQIAMLCKMYNLGCPISHLIYPMKKKDFKKAIKKRVLDHWQELLRNEARDLPSLQYFKSEYYTLARPAIGYAAAGNNSYEVSKLIVQLRMLSGRYRTQRLCRFWSDNRAGYCLMDTCAQQSETVEHIVSLYPALHHVRVRMRDMWLSKTSNMPELYDLVSCILSLSETERTKFILELTQPLTPGPSI